MGYGELLHKSEQRTISPAICVYIDANGLHELNNERGHEAGDLMLRFVAESLIVLAETDCILFLLKSVGKNLVILA